MSLIESASMILLKTPVLVAASQLFIFILCTLVFKQKRKADYPTSFHILLIGLSFLAVGIMNLLAVLGPSVGLAYEINALQTLFWAVIFTVIISVISGMQKLRYALSIIVFSIILILAIAPARAFFLINFIAFYLIAISFFVLFAFSVRPIRNAGFYGLIMVFISTFFTILEIEPASYVWLVPNLLLAASLTYFVRFGLLFDHFVRPTKLELIERDSRGRAVSIWKPFMYLFTYLVLLNTIIFVASISLHELGHLAVGSLFGCESGEIVLLKLDLLQQGPLGPYTELNCPLQIEKAVLALSGHAFIIPFGLVFLLLRRFPEKNFAYVIIGLALTLSGLDMLLIFQNALIIPLVSVIPGITLFCVGEVYLINDYITFTRQQHHRRRRRRKPARQQKRGLEINIGAEEAF
ncbi:MAG: hypothetical protein HY518_03245 [Candidatus Aenigmarchaeota archaeon]|nr:hypothetical protein [Candidatus Aenigmarchaeota archaeon]